MIYAIQNKRTKRFYFGMDCRFEPPRHRTDPELAKLFFSKYSADTEFKIEKFNREYEVVPVKVVVISTQFEFPIVKEVAENTNYLMKGFE